MLKKLGNIFKSELPVTNLAGTRIPSIENSVLNFNRILANYTRYERNTNIFRTYIEIDTNKAKELDLSYFKTITINKFQNSKYSAIKLGYTSLLDENQRIDLKKFLTQENLDRNFDLIKNDILGRDLNLSEIHNKFSVENFASRKSYNYNLGLTVDNNLNISQYQDLFFELAFNTTFNFGTVPETFSFLNSVSQYDLIIYAMNSNDEIIDVKKINNFNTANVNWNIDKTTLLYDIDDVDFNKLFRMSFDTAIFNSLRRQFYINITEECKALKNNLGFFPVETISIQENSRPIELQLDKINVAQAFSTSDKITLNCNEDLTLQSVPVVLNYKLFMKIAGRNSYIIKTFTNTITDRSAIDAISQKQNLMLFLANTKITYFTGNNSIKVELSLLKSAFNDNNFNPSLSSIFINDNPSIDYAPQAFTFIPRSESIEDLNLTGTALKSIVQNSKNQTENNSIFYLRNYSNNPLTLKFVFEQDFEIYEISFPIEVIYELTDYQQSLNITNNNLNLFKDFSNLNVEYSIKIKNFKNSNTNLNRFISLNYENIFLQEIQQGTSQLTENFENNIFVIIKKSIYQEDIKVKDKYYIFNKDINFGNLQLQTENDLNLILNFNDDLALNQFFFTNLQLDNVDITKNVKYTFDARIMIIPLGFFITSNNFETQKRIKEILCLNNAQSSIPSQSKINEIFQILKGINEDKFNNLNQIFLYKLYNDFCLKNTQASNELVLSTQRDTTINLNRLRFKDIQYNLINLSNQTKKLNFTINFDVILKTSNNTNLALNLNNLTNVINRFFFRDNSLYITTSQIIPEFTELELQRELQNNLSYTFNVTSSSVELVTSLNISAELRRFFNLAYSRSTLNFAPYNFNFLDRNLYLRLNLPTTLNNTTNNIVETIEFKNIENQYILLDFYTFLN
jgi:hypothetical protein